MTGAAGDNPALVAAREAETLVRGHLQRGENFLLEAGAGAGKTYSLIETLRFLIEVRDRNFGARANASPALPIRMPRQR